MRSVSILSLLAGLAYGLPALSPTLHQPRNEVAAQCFTGTNFPAESKWWDFHALWDANSDVLHKYNSQKEIDALSHSIETHSKTANINPSIIFAMVMQESGGDIHIRHGDGGRSRGALQIASGASCFGLGLGACLPKTIDTMVSEGIFGTAGSVGFLKCYKQFGGYGPALRCYNSGQYGVNLADLTIGLGTRSYVSDVGNRLLGVVDIHKGTCKF